MVTVTVIPDNVVGVEYPSRDDPGIDLCHIVVARMYCEATLLSVVNSFLIVWCKALCYNGAIALWPEGVYPCLYRKLSKKSGISSFSAPFCSIEFLISNFGKGNPEYSCLYLLHVLLAR